MTKLYVARRRETQRVVLRASPQAILALDDLRDRYRALTGKTLSSSVIIRRALEAHAERLQKQGRKDLTIGGNAKEAAAVLRCATL